ncbi:MAG: hypothetical protein KAI72_07620 [Candidatus Pacebacteria bacterium]|nr:hypothetical protein [Candidatus Paceibacterota bacterium]
MTKSKILLGLITLLLLGGGMSILNNSTRVGSVPPPLPLSGSEFSKDLICPAFKKAFAENKPPKQSLTQRQYKDSWSLIDENSCFIEKVERIMKNGSTDYYEATVGALFVDKETEKKIGSVYFIMKFAPKEKGGDWTYYVEE